MREEVFEKDKKPERGATLGMEKSKESGSVFPAPTFLTPISTIVFSFITHLKSFCKWVFSRGRVSLFMKIYFMIKFQIEKV